MIIMISMVTNMLSCRFARGEIRPPIDGYQGRPLLLELDRTTFMKYFELYEILEKEGARNERTKADGTKDEDWWVYLGLDAFGHPVYRRPKTEPNICRFTDCNPSSDIECFGAD